MPSRSTSASTRPRPAPSAIRSPMSCVRCATTNDITPKMPTAASASATAAKLAKSTVVKRSPAIDSCTSCSIVFTSAIGRSGSLARMAAATALLDAGRIARAADGHAAPGQGLCQNGTSISGNPSSFGPALRTFA